MQKYVAIVLGVILVAALVLVTSMDRAASTLPSPDLIVLVQTEEGHTVFLVDENGENPVQLTGNEVLGLASIAEEVWRNDQSAYEPLSIAGLYLMAGEEFPSAYSRYESFARDLIDSDIKNDDLYIVVYAMTWDHWYATQTPHLVPALEMLYDLGRTRIRLAGFNPASRYRDSEEVNAPYDPFVCTSLSNQIMMVGMLGDLLGMHDRKIWMMHGGDAALSCYMCGGVPDGTYDPQMAWMLYHGGQMEVEAQAAAVSMGNAALTAAVGTTPVELNACQEQFVQELQVSGSDEELVDEAVLWYALSGMNDRSLVMLLNQGAEYADEIGQFDVASYIRSYTDPADLGDSTETWEPPQAEWLRSNTVDL